MTGYTFGLAIAVLVMVFALAWRSTMIEPEKSRTLHVVVGVLLGLIGGGASGAATAGQAADDAAEQVEEQVDDKIEEVTEP